jgi:glycosyltransferase involved in cell wall biosynthesis
MLYPAKTWPHKNHIRLFQALARLRDRHDLIVPLVCTGKPVDSHWPRIRKTIEALSLEKTVVFTGNVDADQMAALFSTAEFLVFPSLFEGLGIPLLEAMHFGLPIVTSNVTCLPEMAGAAALYFDPLSVGSIADAIQYAFSHPSLLDEFRVKGFSRVRRFNWEEAARQFQACYRYVAKWGITSEDHKILAMITREEAPE